MKRLKILLLVISIFVTAVSFAACKADKDNGTGGGEDAPKDTDGKTLVVYFSCTNNTKSVAQKIQTAAGADIYEIVPAIPYTPADLSYNVSDCRANLEQNNPNARPEISGGVENIAKYDTVFIGYPIWWGQAPKIIYTFLESYDFSGKTIIPFCTSGSSGIGSSADNLHGSTQNAVWLDGKRFSSGVSQSDINSWVRGLNLNDISSENFLADIDKFK